MKQAYDCGVNFFDTAERYALFEPGSSGNPDQADIQCVLVMLEGNRKLSWA